MATKRQKRKRQRRQATAERGGSVAPPQPAPTPPPAVSARRTDGPPPAPWGSFPLSELVVLIALILLVGGFFVRPPRGAVMIGAGLVLGSLAGLELAVREHFAGYRSHTLLLAGAVGMAVFGGLFVGVKALSPAICLAAGVVALAAAAWLFARIFRRRSGGALYRFKGG
jgi:hypothetical protein